MCNTAESTKLPSLSAKQLWKLKQLSLMSMAASTARLAYVEMMSCLDLATSEEVESLVISCIDAGLLDAKMNQVSRIAVNAELEDWRSEIHLMRRDCGFARLSTLPPPPVLRLVHADEPAGRSALRAGPRPCSR